MHYFFVDFSKSFIFFPGWFATLTLVRLLRDLIEARFPRFLEFVRGRLVASLLFSLKPSSITDNG